MQTPADESVTVREKNIVTACLIKFLSSSDKTIFPILIVNSTCRLKHNLKRSHIDYCSVLVTMDLEGI